MSTDINESRFPAETGEADTAYLTHTAEAETDLGTGAEETPEKKTPESRTLKKNEYIEGVGRRKRATARVRIYAAPPARSASVGGFFVNNKSADEFFGAPEKEVTFSPLEYAAMENKLRVTAQVHGGGVRAQAEAVRMGLARALVKLEPSLRGKLKRAGFLTRDPREKERKKPGLKKARRAPQFSKR